MAADERASYELRRAIQRGEVSRPLACERCGRNDKKIVGHHDDYRKPLNVRWLCRACHRKVHLDLPDMLPGGIVPWKFPYLFVERIKLAAMKRRMWVEEFVKMAVDKYIKEDC